MRIGIISDIHGTLSDDAMAALSGCDQILCAGDSETPDVLYELEGIAPVTAVLGNCDHMQTLVQQLPAVVNVRIGGLRFYMVHRPEDVHIDGNGADVIVHGHTHVPRYEKIGNAIWINPGSPTYPRGGSMPTVAIMDVRDGHVQDVEFITLDAPHRSSLW